MHTAAASTESIKTRWDRPSLLYSLSASSNTETLAIIEKGSCKLAGLGWVGSTYSGQLRQNHEIQGWKNIIYHQIQSQFTQYLMNASLVSFDIIIFDK